MRNTCNAVIALTFAVALLFSATSHAHAASSPRMRCPDGRPPKAVLVELPQDALKLWHEARVRDRAVVVLSEDLPIKYYDDAFSPIVIKMMEDGRWDEALNPGYPTADFHPVDRSDYLFFAYRMGIISRIYWVPPTKEPVGEESLEGLKRYLGLLGASADELSGLKQTKDTITGSVNGIPLVIARLDELPKVEDGALMAVDLTFLTRNYKNEINTPALEMFVEFAKKLAKAPVRPSEVVVSYSTADGKLPLEYRFLAGYTHTFVSSPDKLKKGPLLQWHHRADAMYNDTFFQPEEAFQSIEAAVKLSPDDASLRYDLAMEYFSLKDVDGMKRELDRAVALQKWYYPAFITYGNYFSSQDIPDAAEDFLKSAMKANPGDYRVYEALHKHYIKTDNREAALAAQTKIIELGYNGPLPTAALADDLAALGRHAEAVEKYEAALGMLPLVDTEQRPKALIGLAAAYANAGNIRAALDTYKEAIRVTGDEHAREAVIKKYEELNEKWRPFMGGQTD